MDTYPGTALYNKEVNISICWLPMFSEIVSDLNGNGEQHQRSNQDNEKDPKNFPAQRPRRPDFTPWNPKFLFDVFFVAFDRHIVFHLETLF